MSTLPTLMQVLDAAYAADETDSSSHLTDDLERLVRRMSHANPKDRKLANLANLLSQRVSTLSDD